MPSPRVGFGFRVSGFGSDALQGASELTAVSNNAGVDDFGLGQLLQTRQVRCVLFVVCSLFRCSTRVSCERVHRFPLPTSPRSADQAHDLLLRGGEQGIRAAVLER